MLVTSSITMPSLMGLSLCMLLGEAEKGVCFLSVMLWNDQVCTHDFTIKALEYRNGFGTVGYGRFVVVHLFSTLSLQRWAEPPQNGKVENVVKFWIFRTTVAMQ